MWRQFIKKRYLENFYTYKFIKVVENVKYNAKDDSITYMKNGKPKTLFNMEDLNFTISDEKYCFSDLMDKKCLMEIYEIHEDKIIDTFTEECQSFIRYGILDLENENLKIVNSNVEDIQKAKPDGHHYSFSLSYQTDEGPLVYIPLSTIEQLQHNLEKNDIEFVQSFLKSILSNLEEAKKIIDIETKQSIVSSDNIENISTEEQLNSLIGLELIKKQVQKLKNYLVFSSKVGTEVILGKPNLNMVFMGNPGTGKTTVAKILAKMFYELGYITENKVGELSVRDFIAQFVGQTDKKAHEVINEYKNGVIFIDEAYLFCSRGQLYANEALGEIIKEMEKKETVFIFAGYQEEMKQFIQMNPGLTSRIGYQLEFKDYTLEELYSIFLRKVEISKLHMDEKIGTKIKLLISDFMRKEHFGNGRFIDNLFDKILLRHASRCYNSDDLEELTTLTEEDINVEIREELKLEGKTKKIGF